MSSISKNKNSHQIGPSSWTIEMKIPREVALTGYLVFNLGGFQCSRIMARSLFSALKNDTRMVKVSMVTYQEHAEPHLISRLEKGMNVQESQGQQDRIEELIQLFKSL